MAFSARAASASMADINITPLVDVMLVLLVIFMVTAPLLDNRQLLTLPATHISDTPKVEPRELQVEAGEIFRLDGVALAPAQLELALRDWRQATPDGILRLVVADDADYQSTARAMAAAERAGVEHISLAGL
ncbi:ExbD/TolR family protein [Arenimonas composti]|nr:biopolymer transporter ExbD [Arenimonas composti]